MNEYADSPSRKDEVWFSRQGRDMKAIPVSCRMQISPDEQFWLRVLAANLGHHA